MANTTFTSGELVTATKLNTVNPSIISTGSTAARTLAVRAADEVNVADYGTGSSAFKLACAAIQTKGGGVLNLETNTTYTIDWRTEGAGAYVTFSSLKGVTINGNGSTLLGVDAVYVSGSDNGIAGGARQMLEFSAVDGLTINDLKLQGTYNTHTTDPDHSDTYGEIGIWLRNGTQFVKLNNTYALNLNQFFDVSDYTDTNGRENAKVSGIVVTNPWVKHCRYGFAFYQSGDNVEIINARCFNCVRSYRVHNVANHDVRIYSEPSFTSSDVLISSLADSRWTRADNTTKNIKLSYESPKRFDGYTQDDQAFYDALITLQVLDETANDTAINPSGTVAPGFLENIDINLNVQASTTSSQILTITKRYGTGAVGSGTASDNTGVTRGHKIDGIRISGRVRGWSTAHIYDAEVSQKGVAIRLPDGFHTANEMNWAGDVVRNIVIDNLVTEGDPSGTYSNGGHPNDGEDFNLIEITGDAVGSTDKRVMITNSSIEGKIGYSNFAAGTNLPVLINSTSNNRKANQGAVDTVAAWVKFDGGTAVISDSYNVSSVSRMSTGRYSIVLSVTMNNANYVVVGSARIEATFGTIFHPDASTDNGVSSLNVNTTDEGGTLTDATFAHVAIIGQIS